MKKLCELLLTVVMAFLLTACNTESENGNTFSAPPLISTTSGSEASLSTDSTDNASQNTSATENTDDTSASTIESSLPEQSSEKPAKSSEPTSEVNSTPQQSSSTSNTASKPINEPASTSTTTPVSATQTIPETTPESEKAKVLVAYFSATNTTEGVAQIISDALNADIYEITPEIPYTSADLDYHSDSSRSTIEMNDPDARPAIFGSVNDMGQYDIVFIGYPIWWGEAPRILSTFVESYDFSDKTVVPFCTSGGSGVGSSDDNLKSLTSGADWIEGTRLSGSASSDEIIRWINDLDLDVTAE